MHLFVPANEASKLRKRFRRMFRKYAHIGEQKHSTFRVIYTAHDAGGANGKVSWLSIV